MTIDTDFIVGEAIESTLSKIDGETLSQFSFINNTLLTNVSPLKVDLDVFYKLFKAVVEGAITQQGLTWDIIVARENPDEENQKEWQDIITFKLKKREFGGTNQRSVDDPIATRPTKPTLVKIIPDPDHIGYEIEIHEQRFENKIIITPWALTPEEADFRAMWLEEVMLNFNFFFLANGIDDVIYLGRNEDIEKFLSPGKVKHFGCPLEYWVRTTKRYVKKIKTLDEVIMVLKQNARLLEDV